MHCAQCGAGAIAGATRCYRCDRPFANAEPAEDASPFTRAPPTAPARAAPTPVTIHAPTPPRAHAPAPARAPTRRAAAPTRTAQEPSTARSRIAPGAAFGIAALCVADLATGDPPGILIIGAFFALTGVALLRTWRGARPAAWTLFTLGVLFGLVATFGGGIVVGPAMAIGSGVGIVGLFLGRPTAEAAGTRTSAA